MPIRIYCTNGKCAFPIDYSLDKPIFCPKCGEKIGGNHSFANTRSSQAVIKEKVEEPIVSLDTDIRIDDIIRKANRVDVAAEINVYEGSTGIKAEDIAFEQKTGLKRVKGKKVNVKKEMEKFREEAGAGGRKVIEVNDSGAA